MPHDEASAREYLRSLLPDLRRTFAALAQRHRVVVSVREAEQAAGQEGTESGPKS